MRLSLTLSAAVALASTSSIFAREQQGSAGDLLHHHHKHHNHDDHYHDHDHGHQGHHHRGLETGIDRCGTKDPSEESKSLMNGAVNEWLEKNAINRALPPPQTVVVPTYYHYTDANIPTGGDIVTAIMAQHNHIVQAYAGTPFTFTLQAIFNLTGNGWENIDDPSPEESAMKANRQGGSDALNVYIVSSIDGSMNETLGYATFPDKYADNPMNDGVVLGSYTLPGMPDTPADYEGDTLTHEAGHWFGLYHTFMDGCNPGDGVVDTPPEAEPAYRCPIGRDTCPAEGVDPIHNYMNYVDDYCMDEFTRGQATRMVALWDKFRVANFCPTQPPVYPTGPSIVSRGGYWVPPLSKPGVDCEHKRIKIPEHGTYTCIEVDSGICRDNGGNFGLWLFGIDTVDAANTPDINELWTYACPRQCPDESTYPSVIDPATKSYPLIGPYVYATGNGPTKEGEICKLDGVASPADCRYAGTTHICIGENKETDPKRFSNERPYMFFYNEKRHEFLYQLVCDGIGEEGRLPQLKMVNNEDLAYEHYVEYPVDITKFKKGPTDDPTDVNELWNAYVDWNGYKDPQTKQVGKLAAFTNVAHDKFCTEYVSATTTACWEEGADCSDVQTSDSDDLKADC